MGAEPEARGPDAQARRRTRMWLKLLQLTATVGAFTYLALTVDWSQMRDAYRRASPTAFFVACGIYYLALAVGTVRWRLLLFALGAERQVSLLRLFRLYVIGLFYNTYVPGGVGGDVVRALAIRDVFAQGGAAASLATVLIERAMGLGGMLVVVAGATLLFPLPAVAQFTGLGAIGLLLAVAGFVGLAFARRLADFLPEPIAGLLRRLPAVTHYWPVPPAVLTAVVTHLLTALAGYVVIVTVAPQVTLTQALTLVPLALAAVYLPISIGGVGVVEVALVHLLGLVGVAEEDALVAALVMRACQWAVAAPGGLLVLATPSSSTRTA